jgi:hypothetical protein
MELDDEAAQWVETRHTVDTDETFECDLTASFETLFASNYPTAVDPFETMPVTQPQDFQLPDLD